MHHHYRDIRDRIADPPLWWDEHAVPRYSPFAPNEVANIYAQQVTLLEIACQGCGTRFAVAFSWDDYVFGTSEDGTSWVRQCEPMTPERVQSLHYGDPPNAWCCAAGPTMNSVPLRVLEFWRRGGKEFTRYDPEFRWASWAYKCNVCLPGYSDWRRVPELEIRIEDVGT